MNTISTRRNRFSLDELYSVSVRLCIGTMLAGIVVWGSPALAQQRSIDTPKIEQPRQGGGTGTPFNLTSIFNALKNLVAIDPPQPPPTLHKQATNVSSTSGGNYTIDWVVQYANNTGVTQPNVTVTDGPLATIIPSSLQQPLGWTGATNLFPPVDNFAKWTGTSVAPQGVMTAPFPAPLSSSIAISGSGDGYQPIPYTRVSAPSGPRIYMMNHHLAPGAASFKCVDLTTGMSCPGWGTGKTLPAGDGSTNSSETTNINMEYVIDNGKIYYASRGPAGIGIGCVNLETDTQCGFTQFGPMVPGILIHGPWRIGNELYAAAHDGALYCANLSTGMLPCVGGNFKIPSSTITINVSPALLTPYPHNFGGRLAGKVLGSKLYITSIKGALKYTNCFDATTKTACWSTTAPSIGSAPYSFSNGPIYNVSNYFYYNPSGIAVALCTMRSSVLQECVDTVTGAQKIGLPTVLPGLNLFPALALGAGLETMAAGKTYFVASHSQGDNRDDAWCWNWATQSACSSGPLGKIATGPFNAQNYGSNIDDQGCIWAYGHNKKLWHFDPNNLDPQTGLAKPCNADPGKFRMVFQPLQYCSGPKPFHWTSVAVTGAPLANYSKFIVRVLNSSSNAVLFTKDLIASNTTLADISSVDAQTLSTTLKIEIEYTAHPGMGTTDHPVLEVHYNAPPLEFCFKSTHTCQQGKITNTVKTPDLANPGQDITVTVAVDLPQSCGDTIPACGQPGQPDCPCQTCGTASTPPCPVCGQAGQPPCPACGQAGQPPCPPPTCIPGTPGCTSGTLCLPGDPACTPVIITAVCLTGFCPDKPPQSVPSEYELPKIACVRKPKPTNEVPKKVLVKPKPQSITTTPVVTSPSIAKPKPKSKPRVKPLAEEDDCK